VALDVKGLPCDCPTTDEIAGDFSINDNVLKSKATT